MKPTKIIIIGPQGSGKGTQAELLAKHLQVPALAMGQLLRDEIAQGSEIGKKIDSILKAGNLVSDQVAAQVLQNRLAKPDAVNGYVLDGYPRNLSQYEAFTFDAPTALLVLEVPREESLKRLSGRVSCSVCGKIGSMRDGIKIGNLCPCGGKFVQRADDTEVAISRRLQVYHDDTIPVIQQYEKQGIVHRVNGVGSIEEIHQRILKVIKLEK